MVLIIVIIMLIINVAFYSLKKILNKLKSYELLLIIKAINDIISKAFKDSFKIRYSSL